MQKAKCKRCSEVKWENHFSKGQLAGRRMCKECVRHVNKNRPLKYTEEYIYIITNPAFINWYKIGTSKNCDTRLNSYQTSCPKRDFKIVFKVFVEDAKNIEKEIHSDLIAENEWIFSEDSLDSLIYKIKHIIKNHNKSSDHKFIF